jgi:HEAT repeat protein
MSCGPFVFVLSALAAAPMLAARDQEAVTSRPAQIEELIGRLRSDDLHVADQAARDLGYLKATEAVPALPAPCSPGTWPMRCT